MFTKLELIWVIIISKEVVVLSKVRKNRFKFGTITKTGSFVNQSVDVIRKFIDKKLGKDEIH